MRILHLFNWKLSDIDVSLVHSQGFDAIQINPLQPLKDEINKDWWLSYQPISHTIGNRFGSEEDLKNLCTKANNLGIIIIADVVLNHVAGKDNGSIYPHEKVDSLLVNNKYFWKSFDRIYDWNNRYDVITKSIGVPGLNLKNIELQHLIINFLNRYIELGVKGFRFDASKNIELPSEGSTFWINIVNAIKNKTVFNYAEVIYSSKELLTEYSKYINVLTEGYIDDVNKLVTFVESHDTYLEFGCTSKMDDGLMISEYQILTNRFPNTIFYARPYNELWKNERIKEINKYE